MTEFKHKHKFGQNFLKDKNVLMKMIDAVDVQDDDLIIEIGPGQGALTKYLKLYKANLLCFEIDLDTKKYLDGFEDDKTHIVFEDFMSVDINKFVNNIKYNNLYVMANLPYYITTPIIEKLINSKLDVKSMVLMVQNEVADRLSAKPGTKDYGAISVYLSYYYEIEKLVFVPRSSFEPVPNVDSAVIKLVSAQREKVNDEELFFKLIRDAFHMKRKNLKNNLKEYNLEIIEKVLKKYNLTLQDRAERVPLNCFIDMANDLSK